MCFYLASLTWVRHWFIRDKIRVSKEPLFNLDDYDET